MLDNQESADVDTQEHSFTRTIDEEAEMEEQAERDREEGHPEQEDEEEEREHEVMTAGSKYWLCVSIMPCPLEGQCLFLSEVKLRNYLKDYERFACINILRGLYNGVVLFIGSGKFLDTKE